MFSLYFQMQGTKKKNCRLVIAISSSLMNRLIKFSSLNLGSQRGLNDSFDHKYESKPRQEH